VFPPGLGTSKGVAVDLSSTNRYSLTTLTYKSNNHSNREEKLTKTSEGCHKGMLGNRAGSYVRHYVSRNFQNFPTQSQDYPRLRTAIEKEGT
jgi:hypothetical protein